MIETSWALLCVVFWTLWFVSALHDSGIGALMLLFGLTARQRGAMDAAMRDWWGYSVLWLCLACACTALGYVPLVWLLGLGLRDGLVVLGAGLLLRLAAFLWRERPGRGGGMLTPASLCMYAGSLLVIFLAGVLAVNVSAGLPFGAGTTGSYGLPALMGVYGCVGGFLSLALGLLHGALWLGVRTEGDFRKAALGVARKSWIGVVGLTLVLLALTENATRLYNNFVFNPVLFLVPLLAVTVLVFSRAALGWGRPALALLLAGGYTVLMGVMLAIGSYPTVLASAEAPEYNVVLADVRVTAWWFRVGVPLLALVGGWAWYRQVGLVRRRLGGMG